MARVVSSNSDVYAASVYGQPHPTTLSFIQNQISAPTHMLSDIGREFADKAMAMYESFHGEDAMRRATRALQTSEHRWDDNVIRPLCDINALQTAPLVMHRYLMACPEVRTMYHDMRLDGYSEEYVDLHPGMVGEDHYDYRRVMNGIVDTDGDDESSYVEYIESLDEGDRELYFTEQTAVLRSWDQLLTAVWEDDEDPTSRYGDSL